MTFSADLSTIATMAILTLGVTHAGAQIADITVNNGQGTDPAGYTTISTPTNSTNPDPRAGVFALGYLNYNCIPDKSWDLEAFGYNANTNSLTYVGGFNPLQANEGYSLGDIFISQGAVVQPGGLSQGMDYSNPGYTYAIHLIPGGGGPNPTNIGYDIYQLTNTTQLQTVAFNQNLVSDPYALDLNNLGGATIVASGSADVQTGATGNDVNTLLGETLFNTANDQASADNYILSLNLAPWSLTGGFKASLTEQCGNDALAGVYPGSAVAAPEPTSVYNALLATIFFLGMFQLRKRTLQP